MSGRIEQTARNTWAWYDAQGEAKLLISLTCACEVWEITAPTTTTPEEVAEAMRAVLALGDTGDEHDAAAP